MTKEQLLGMLSEGFNLNQIAAIHMISKEKLEMLLTEEATKVTSTGASGKITKPSSTTASSGTSGTSGGSGTADRPLFEEEPGL